MIAQNNSSMWQRGWLTVWNERENGEREWLEVHAWFIGQADYKWVEDVGKYELGGSFMAYCPVLNLQYQFFAHMWQFIPVVTSVQIKAWESEPEGYCRKYIGRNYEAHKFDPLPTAK